MEKEKYYDVKIEIKVCYISPAEKMIEKICREEEQFNMDVNADKLANELRKKLNEEYVTPEDFIKSQMLILSENGA